MTALALAAQRLLVQDPDILGSGLVGVDDTWTDGWVFPDKPAARVENSSKCAIIIFDQEPWTSKNPHNRAEFGTITVDIFGDPSRDVNENVTVEDAQDKIERVAKIVSRNFHVVHPSVPSDAPDWMGAKTMPRIWGTAEQIASRTGLTIVESIETDGPTWNPMSSNQGGWRGRYRYNVQYSSPI